MSTTTVVQHPDLPDVYRTVPSDEATEWTEQGWKRVKKADVPAHVVTQTPGVHPAGEQK